MRHFTVGAVVVAAALCCWTGSALSQESRATVRTYQGISYTLADPSLEVFYTIGEPKEKKDEGLATSFQPTIAINATAGSPAGGEQAPSGYGGAEQESKLLRGHSRAAEITIRKNGVETRVVWERIRSLSFSRKPVAASGAPLYPTVYRYAASAVLVDGARVDGDYVNLGTTMLRGHAPAGRVDIPWTEIESIVLD